ncbi:MgtC/SapB family protein [Vampirovibrio chlorellavorus]|uniref:MgtC/SapB family protein n=1 Tax=Vampirovibrio chlorellavorus TaxID=758823 RepID=UPI0026EDA70C|nr:MgtC/SapB family protein [Vampirovibrio chlorellavorus]
MELSLQESILRLFLALLLGSVVGMEREYTQQSAGLRTHILVCLGATVFTLVSITDMSVGLSYANADPNTTYRMVRDPARIAAQIVPGIGFIGGGAVLRHGANIRGLTTAASLWMMASIGMLLGVGSYQLAIIATLFSFLVLFIIGGLERTMFKKYLKKYILLKIQVTAKEDSMAPIEQWLEEKFPAKTMAVKVQRHPESQTVSLTYNIDLRGMHADVNTLSRNLNNVEGVTSASVRVLQEDKEF